MHSQKTFCHTPGKSMESHRYCKISYRIFKGGSWWFVHNTEGLLDRFITLTCKISNCLFIVPGVLFPEIKNKQQQQQQNQLWDLTKW